jgi:hypothetical protein
MDLARLLDLGRDNDIARGSEGDDPNDGCDLVKARHGEELRIDKGGTLEPNVEHGVNVVCLFEEVSVFDLGV